MNKNAIEKRLQNIEEAVEDMDVWWGLQAYVQLQIEHIREAMRDE